MTITTITMMILFLIIKESIQMIII
ncbi:hypothetical protein BLA29_014475 [Euroglyphus maynei]|uniref:Uncharacterized protein n=1 Tax=Euroglyphus maynei TaxID=6958 RepID=A0A1Y3AR71_EURMA|nr:hypothetical protein BLA29_014475 [Euroglyphus maynei]